MNAATDRRAVLGTALAAAALSATAVSSAVAASRPQLSAVDRHILDLWRQRAELSVIADGFDVDRPKSMLSRHCGRGTARPYPALRRLCAPGQELAMERTKLRHQPPKITLRKRTLATVK
jgi:hypothetical protein